MTVLTPPMLRFCEQVAMGMSATRAYSAAYPNASHGTAASNAYNLLRRPGVDAEILRLRTLAQQAPGSAVMTLFEKRSFLARVVRSQIALLPRESDLWERVWDSRGGTFYRLPDKIEAIKLDNKLSADDPMQQDSLMQLLISVRK
jgi:hypothetical protein